MKRARALCVHLFQPKPNQILPTHFITLTVTGSAAVTEVEVTLSKATEMRSHLVETLEALRLHHGDRVRVSRL